MGRRESGERELIVIAWLSIDISLGRGGIEGRSTGRPWWSRLSVCTPDAGSGSWCADQQPRVCVCRVHGRCTTTHRPLPRYVGVAILRSRCFRANGTRCLWPKQ